MAITADLKKDSTRVRSGGGNLWIVEYDSTKLPYQPHATLKQEEVATATTLHCWSAVTGDFGATGTLDIDIFAVNASAEQKAFSALSANNFTNTALTTTRSAGDIVKLTSASDYTLTAWKNLGELAGEGTEITDDQSVDKIFNELRQQIGSVDGDRSLSISPVLAQTGKAEFDFLCTEARSKLFALKYVVPVAGVGTFIFVVKLAKLVTKISAKFGTTPRNLKVQFDILTDGNYAPFTIYEG